MFEILTPELLKGNTYGTIMVYHDAIYYKLVIYTIDNELHADYTYSADKEECIKMDLKKTISGENKLKNWREDFLKSLCETLQKEDLFLYKNDIYESIMDVLRAEGNILVNEYKLSKRQGKPFINGNMIKPYDNDNHIIKYIYEQVQKNNYL